jgi:hypothetical protein
MWFACDNDKGFTEKDCGESLVMLQFGVGRDHWWEGGRQGTIWNLEEHVVSLE